MAISSIVGRLWLWSPPAGRDATARSRPRVGRVYQSLPVRPRDSSRADGLATSKWPPAPARRRSGSPGSRRRTQAPPSQREHGRPQMSLRPSLQHTILGSMTEAVVDGLEVIEVSAHAPWSVARCHHLMQRRLTDARTYGTVCPSPDNACAWHRCSTNACSSSPAAPARLQRPWHGGQEEGDRARRAAGTGSESPSQPCACAAKSCKGRRASVRGERRARVHHRARVPLGSAQARRQLTDPLPWTTSARVAT